MVKKSTPSYFKGQAPSVDGNILRGVVILQSGEDKAGDNFDHVSLEQLVLLGNAQSQGVKSRFGHPNMCDSSLGTFIGRYKNFQTSTNSDGKAVVIADLHLDDVAKKSPKGDLYTYTIEMAQKNSEMFGNSIVYNPAETLKAEEVDASGNKIVKEYQRFKSFVASDLVDSPCATDNLFKDTESLAVKATEWLDENPEIFELVAKHPEILKSFLIKYTNYKQR